MSRGTPALATYQRIIPAPAPTVTGADNGVSLNGTTVNLGQSVADPGNPAALIDSREIPMNGFGILFTSSIGELIVIENPSGIRINLAGDLSASGTGAYIAFSDNTASNSLNIGPAQSGFPLVTGYAISLNTLVLNFVDAVVPQLLLTYTPNDAPGSAAILQVKGDENSGSAWFQWGILYRNFFNNGAGTSYPVSGDQSGTIFTDDNSVYELPDATTNVGARFGFVVRDGFSNNVNVLGTSTDVIYYNGVAYTSFTSNAIGSFIWIVSVGAGIWIIESQPNGTWTFS